MKQEKGITLIALVITIIVLLILAGIAVTSGTIGIGETEDRKLVTELGIVEHAALERYTKANITKEAYPGTAYQTLEQLKTDISQMKDEIQLQDTNIENYYLLKKEDLEELGITNTEDQYIINYKTGEVINQTKQKTTKGKVLYINAKS